MSLIWFLVLVSIASLIVAALLSRDAKRNWKAASKLLNDTAANIELAKNTRAEGVKLLNTADEKLVEAQRLNKSTRELIQTMMLDKDLEGLSS